MLRKIIKIDERKCNGCGACAAACHEGAIGMAGGKAKLLRDDYCDGLGDCLPACPTGAISFEEREAAPYDEAAVKKQKTKKTVGVLPCGCAGTHSRTITRKTSGCDCGGKSAPSRLSQWPVQIKLVPADAPYFDGASLLVAADCTAYAYGDFHEKFIKGRITLVGCPKLDDADYAEKLGQIFARNDVGDVTVTRMEVPCCSGIESAVKRAVASSGKDIPVRVITITADGRIE